MPCPGWNKCRRGCRHAAMIEDYYAARDSRDQRRESSEFLQHEQDDFNEALPVVTFKDWLPGWGMRY